MLSLGFIRTLLHHHFGMVLLILAAGALSGVFSAAIVAVINHLLHPHLDRLTLLAAGFAGLVAGKVMTNVLSQMWLVRFAQDAIIEVTMELCSKVLQSSLRTIERAGASQIFAALTDDVGSVVWAAQCIPSLAMNGAMIAGCGVYLLWLSPAAFAGVAGVTAVGAVGYYELHRRSFPIIASARDAKAKTFAQFRGLTDGIKELLLDVEKGRCFLDQELRQAIVTLRQSNLGAFRHQLMGDSWTQVLYYLLIGLLLLAFPAVLEMTPESLTGFVFAILFLMNPLWAVIGALPAVARGQIALSRMHDLGLSLQATTGEPRMRPESMPAPSPVPLRLTEVSFAYRDADAALFHLGPLNFSLSPGELVFIVGGNGSGKSTFAKVLTGLYVPDSGSARIGDTMVTDDNRAWYRGHFAVIFSDYHLFDRLHGVSGPESDAAMRRYLDLLELTDKVSVSRGRFSSVNLSQGQRRRLALMVAYMEDKPIYVFDEWAADQDPHYKEVFYHTLLPDLCRRGKAVVVITHDDRYFHLGDRVIKLEDGKIADTWDAVSNRPLPIARGATQSRP